MPTSTRLPLPRAPAAAIALACAATLPAQDDLGLGRMWTFERPPLDYLEDEYGFRPDDDWLDAMRLAALRFGNGCSASFVSPRGLILTNHHCVRGDIAANQGTNDWVGGGFVARSLEDEVPLEGLSVRQLAGTADVTAAVNEGIDEDAGFEEIERRRAENRARVLAQARQRRPELEHEIVPLFQGALFMLYGYRVYDDIRLVASPHLQVAHFGGDPDNFTYPRWSIDFAFCRAYEDGAPADTAGHWFRWHENGPDEGEVVFVVGNPGSTERLLTHAQLEFLRDVRYPILRALIDGRLAIMRELAARDPALERRLETTILAYENAKKAYGGMHEALLDEGFMALDAAAERRFRAAVAADPALRERFGDVWEGLAEVAAARAELEPRLRFQTPGGSKRLAKALATLDAAGDEDADVEAVAAMPVDMAPMEEAFFVDHARRARAVLGDGDPWVEAVLGDRDPGATHPWRAATRIGDPAFVRDLLAGGRQAVADSDDPALRVARAIAPLVGRNQAEARRIEARANVLGARLGRALFAVRGDAVSPDATSTLRFGDGVVAGYPYNGTIAPWRTCFYGLYGRHAEFGGEPPFDLPEVWREREPRIDMTRAVDFVCTADSTGGNSGSPVVDRELRLVGLLFDGNIESLGNQFLFRDDVPRTVCVHPAAITEALRKIYEADRVLEELIP